MTFKEPSKQYEGIWVSIPSGATFYIYKSYPNNLRTFGLVELEWQGRMLVRPYVDLGMNKGKGVKQMYDGHSYRYRLIKGILK
jgi:hypothetical protein